MIILPRIFQETVDVKQRVSKEAMNNSQNLVSCGKTWSKLLNRDLMLWLLSLSLLCHCTTGCYVRNCPLGGKRSQLECAACGYMSLGRCMSPGVCCSPSFGCIHADRRGSNGCYEWNSLLTSDCDTGGAHCVTSTRPMVLGKCVSKDTCCSKDGCVRSHICAKPKDTSQSQHIFNERGNDQLKKLTKVDNMDPISVETAGRLMANLLRSSRAQVPNNEVEEDGTDSAYEYGF